MSLLPVGVVPSVGGYNINNSLRLRASANAQLTRTPTTSSNRTTWTFSAWIKRGALVDGQSFFGVTTSGNDNTQLRFSESGGFLNLRNEVGGSALIDILTTSRLFRDPSAWYHIIIVFDSTNATAANRCVMYVNGVSQTLSTNPSGDIALNETTYINSTVLHSIGDSSQNSTVDFDGYLAEVHFVDGQALTQTSFGETNPITGVWQPKKYTGTYGINGFYLPFSDTNSNIQNLFTYSEDLTNAAWTKLNVTVTGNSVAAPNESTTADTIFETVTNGEHFTDRNLTPTTNTQYVFSSYVKYLNRRYFGLRVVYINASQDTLVRFDLLNGVYHSTVGTAATAYSITSVGSGWYRISVTYTTPATNPAATLVFRHQLLNDSLAATYAGNTSVGTYVWGSQLESNGILGAYVATTASAQALANSIGTDRSLGSTVFGYNSWIPNNISLTAGVTYDAMIDSPTLTSATVANYPTLNPLAMLSGTTSATFSNGNLQVTSVSTGDSVIPSTMSMTGSGKYYAEFTAGTASIYGDVGIINITHPTSTAIGDTATSYNYRSNGNKNNNSTQTAYGASYTTNDVIGVAFDVGAGTIEFYKNNVSQGVAYTGISSSESYLFACGDELSAGTFIWTANFGQRPFAYTPPTGYNRLNTYNLPDSTIKKGNSYMDATTYTGNGSSLSVTNNAGFRPDFVWIKGRSGATDHSLYDAVRGTTLELITNSTAAETTRAAGLTAFNSNGFTVGALARVNNNGSSFVGWQWQAGSSTVTNTSGTISAQVRANTTTGFSIVTYTGNGSATASVGHGLGVAPKVVIIKARSTTGNWAFYTTAIDGSNDILNLNTTAAKSDSSAAAPTSSVFNLITTGNWNTNAVTYVAYCWAEIEGFSAFGSYTGNGNANGPFVYLGFKPKFVMYKNSSITADWVIIDSSRGTFNLNTPHLLPNAANAEVSTSSYGLDFLSNGFKCRTSDPSQNGNGNTMIYAAFAENPFKNSLAR